MDSRIPHHAFDELTRLRGIAEEGRRLPLASGRHLILWGCAVAVALCVQWVVTMGWLPIRPGAIALSWFAIMLGAAALGRHRMFATTRFKGHASLGARVERTVWLFGGAFLALAPLGALLSGAVDEVMRGPGHALAGLSGMPALTFGVYAIALAASAEIAAMAELKRFAWLSLCFVPVALLLANSVWQFPVVALGIALVSVVPGTMMLAAERKHEAR